MKSVIGAISLGWLVGLQTQAALISDADMTLSMAADIRHTDFEHVGLGWMEGSSAGAWVTNAFDGRSVVSKTSVSQNQALHQYNLVTDETGDQLTFTFVTYANVAADYNVSLFGWTGNTNGMAGTDMIAQDARYAPGKLITTNNLSGVDLLDGESVPSGSKTGAKHFNTVVGAWQTNSITVDMSTYGVAAVIDNMDDLAVFGIAISDGAGAYGTGDLYFDSITVTIVSNTPPPPVTMNMIGFYNAAAETHNVVKNLKTDYGAVGDTNINESAILQQAIDEISALPGGGDLIIPQDDYLFGAIAFKSDVHIKIEGGTTIEQYVPRVDRNAVIFSMGGGLLEPIHNVSIRGIPAAGATNDRFAVFLRAADNARSFLNTGNVRNFYIANVDVHDEYTTHSCINLFSDGYDWDTGGYAVSGTVANISSYYGHYGYGTVQCQAADSVLFTNLYGLGGCTLRVETGARTMNERQFGGAHNIVGKDISCEIGKSAVMLGPHNMQNGLVTIEGVYATNCAFAATLGGGDTIDTKDVTNPDIRPGTFAAGTSITDITAVYGTNATLKWQETLEIPPELEHLLTSVSPDGGKSKYGPAIATAKFTPVYEAYMTGVKAYGFEYTPPVQTAGTAVGDGYSDDLFSAAEYFTNLNSYFWSVTTTGGGTNWIHGNNVVGILDTTSAMGNHHAVNFQGFTLSENPELAGSLDLEGGPFLRVGSEFRYKHQAGVVSGNLNEAAFGLLLSTDKTSGAGDNRFVLLANRGSGIGLAGMTNGLISHADLGVDPVAGGWSDRFRMEWYIEEGISNYEGIVSVYDYEGGLLFKSDWMDLGLTNGTKVYAGYTTGTNTVGGTVSSFSGFEQVQLDNFKFERGRIDAAPEFRANPIYTMNAVADWDYTAFITADAFDLNEDSMTFEKVSGPAWLNVSTNGMVYGVPGTNDIGMNSFAVQVYGSAGTNTTELLIEVEPAGACYSLLYPEADAYIEGGGDSNQNFGIRPELVVQTGSLDKWTRKTFMRFDLSSITNPLIGRVILRLNVGHHNGGSPLHTFTRVDDDSWEEYDITWSDQPATGAVITTVVCLDTVWWQEVDLTDVIKAERATDQLLSFSMVSSGSAVTFNSRETEEGHRPQLVVYSYPNYWAQVAQESGLNLSGSGDEDLDGESDLMEFALGGDPINSAVQGNPPHMVFNPDNSVSFFNWENTNANLGITYLSEWTEDLVNGTWSNVWDSITNWPTDPGYIEAERRVGGSSDEQLFFRLRITQP
ncbi:DUF7594 domain-containing protein [Pontiella agarivorans]|uniref:DNRLRE domain-containing protein n=1 Tax=Pontiella agarivorans TaxID=3038953 RepID=A0ABU5N1F4_9BACT|nr:DNRLRE domain-containing protein [Pontiella agarivorans]MDZ8120233.1 DNRLRE domain-containing protein [Pontiella agarivorans]